MYGILAILAAVIIYNCGDMLPDSVKEWWENSTLRKWVHPVLTITITIAVALGIQFDILNWGAIVIPVLFGFPYILRMPVRESLLRMIRKLKKLQLVV